MPEEDRRFRFFVKEAYDQLTVPKSLTRESRMNEIRGKLLHVSDNFLRSTEPPDISLLDVPRRNWSSEPSA
jgi:hypothetical protein